MRFYSRPFLLQVDLAEHVDDSAAAATAARWRFVGVLPPNFVQRVQKLVLLFWRVRRVHAPFQAYAMADGLSSFPTNSDGRLHGKWRLVMSGVGWPRRDKDDAAVWPG